MSFGRATAHAWRHVAVERDLAVGIVVRDHDPVAATELHRARQVIAWRDGGSGIVGIIEVDELGAAHHVGGQVRQLQQEPRLGNERIAVRLPAREHRPALVHGVPRLGHDRDVARVEQRHREMGDAFLRSDEWMQLAERIESRAEATSQVCGSRFTKHRQTELERVAAHGGVAHRARQGVYSHRRRGEVGVAGAKIDHIDALREQPALDGWDLRHGIAGQRGESLAELGHPILLYRNLRSAFATRYRPLPSFTVFYRYRLLPSFTVLYRPLPPPPPLLPRSHASQRTPHRRPARPASPRPPGSPWAVPRGSSLHSAW